MENGGNEQNGCFHDFRHVREPPGTTKLYGFIFDEQKSLIPFCAWYGVQPRKDGLGTPPPFLGFFYSYTLQRHPKTLNTNTAPSIGLFWVTLGPGLVMPNFWVFLETPFWATTPQGTPLPSQEGGFLGRFLGRNPPLPRPLPG